MAQKKATKKKVVKKAKKTSAKKKVASVRHKDKRKNIPTEELRDFVRDEENRPKTVLYPRDPDLDPQLVWQGKDEQDAEPLEVPAVPIYIQEKIHPQAIIEDFKRTAARAQPEDHQLSLYADFNGLPEEFDQRVDFYHHEGNWSNRLVLGDSLLVMTSLAEKEGLKGKVQMIYIDPPYGIKFGSNWQVSTRKRDVRDGKAEDACRQPEQVKAFRDTWEKGIHSYLAYLRDRLVVARELADQGKDGWKMKVIGPDDFGRMILDNLRSAGVQNTVKNERMKFDTLQPYAGQWIHGEGQYSEADGKMQRVAVCIGPEHGTVGPELVKEAAKEAVQGVGFDLLIVCGFAFDPHVSEEAKRYGKLVVLPTQMNPDLAMGELLKKTGSANLFMVFGEPDIEITTNKDGQVTVEIKGLDIYDPTTGEIRSSSTDDIACWFIDTDYNGESFFVRHAYFTGGDEPYDKLKKTLRAEIDESAWSQLYSTVSRPFDKPETGKIAVKVINHYGDEVLKVYET